MRMGADTDWSRGLPSFHAPPVIEVAVGVEFVPLPGLSTVGLVHLADLWTSDYPVIQEQPAIPPAAAGPGLHIRPGTPQIRIWMLSPSGDELLQLQHDRVFLNWRRVSDESGGYPRYRYLREQYRIAWERFSEYVVQSEIGGLAPVASEVTFVNRIDLDEGTRFADVISVFDEVSDLGTPINQAVQLGFEIENDQGVAVGRQSILASCNKGDPVVSLELTSRVRIEQNDTPTILQALDDAHAAGVMNFDRMTTEAMHTRWGKI
ncbi:MAG TPA: TIGR04255 family protein [Aldersonia sp.]